MVSEGRVQTAGAAVTKSGTYGKILKTFLITWAKPALVWGFCFGTVSPQLEPCFASGELVEGRLQVPPSVALAG